MKKTAGCLLEIASKQCIELNIIEYWKEALLFGGSLGP